MVRRARPAHRSTQPTTSRRVSGQQSIAQVAKEARPIDFLSESSSAASVPAHSDTSRILEHNDDSGDEDATEDSDGNQDDTDGPRIAQWIDDEDLEMQETDDVSANLHLEESDGDDHSAGETGSSRRLRSLEDDLSTLPLGTLRSAQRSLAQARALSDTESDSGAQSEADLSTEEEDASPYPVQDAANRKHGQSSKPATRTNKHAPVEATSKRPVSRRRVVVDDKLPKPRDPRFMHATGRYDALKFKQQYDFLSGLRNDELATLREHMKRARKLLVNSPSHLRAEREEEVKRLEHAVKRAESTVNLDKREHVELKALQSAKKSEEDKRKQGKASWWMKRSEKRALLEKARLDAIASTGGKRAVNKALEKKQRKISQREKKNRPLSRTEGKRRPVESVDPGRGPKRRKVA